MEGFIRVPNRLRDEVYIRTNPCIPSTGKTPSISFVIGLRINTSNHHPLGKMTDSSDEISNTTNTTVVLPSNDAIPFRPVPLPSIPTSFPSPGTVTGSSGGPYCAGHGVAMPVTPNLPVPPGHCPLCRLEYGTYNPGVSPTAPKNFKRYEDGVMRDANGFISGIIYAELKGNNSYLAEWKDRPIGPGHPLAEGMDPRSFIPSTPNRSPVLPPNLSSLVRPPPQIESSSSSSSLSSENDSSSK